MKNKLIASLLTAGLTIGMLAGCGQTQKQESVSQSSSKTEVVSQGTVEVEEVSNFNKEGYPIVNEEITLNILLCVRDQDTLVDPEDMPVIQQLDELTGIKTEWELIKVADWSTKLNLIMASGEYPDVIISSKGLDDEDYGVDQGIIIPLEDLIEEYVPNYTERIKMELEAGNMDPTVGVAASDGHIYSLGYLVSQNLSTNTQFFINQTWLNALNLEMPDDIESLTEVLRAFKTQDPNGNGQADEIPMTASLDSSSGDFRVGKILALFGIPYTSNWEYIDDNGKMQFIPTRPEFRECMEWLHTCYAEGLLDIEVLSQDYNTANSKLVSGVVGFYGGWRLKNAGLDDGAGKDCVLYVPKEGSFEHRVEAVSSSGRAFVTSTNENVEATMRWFNTILDTEWMFSLYYGEQNPEKDPAKGGWYYEENGMITTIIADPAPSKMEYLGTNGLFFAPGVYYFDIYNMPDYRIEKAEYTQTYKDAGLIQKYPSKYRSMIPLTTEQTQSIDLIRTDAGTAVNEYMAKFIQEGVTDSNWNEFVKIFEALDVQSYIKTYQEALDSMGVIE